MSVMDPDLFLRDEFEFELRAPGRNPKGAVTVLRKQLREALSAGGMLSAVDIADKDRELERCVEKWEELQELSRCVDNLEEGPGSSRGVRRIRQRLNHLNLRLQNLDQQWGTLEQAHDIKSLIEQVTSTLQGLSLIHISPCLDEDAGQEMKISS